MKTHQDPRHLQRIKVMQDLYAWTFREQKTENQTVHEILGSLEQIDKYIKEAAPTWPIEKINKVDLSVLRLAVYELLISKQTPPKVVVDEAVEIAKEYSSEASPSFINGALGKLITDYKLEA